MQSLQWHQLGHMQVCTLLQTDNHASTPPLSLSGPDALPAAQPTKHQKEIVDSNSDDSDCRVVYELYVYNIC